MKLYQSSDGRIFAAEENPKREYLAVGQDIDKDTSKFTEFVVYDVRRSGREVIVWMRSTKGPAGALVGGYRGRVTLHVPESIASRMALVLRSGK